MFLARSILRLDVRSMRRHQTDLKVRLFSDTTWEPDDVVCVIDASLALLSFQEYLVFATCFQTLMLIQSTKTTEVKFIDTCSISHGIFILQT